MIFTDVKQSIQTGDILLFSGGGWYTRFIRLWTLSRYNHVGIAIWVQANGYKELFILESLEPHGTRLVPLGPYVERSQRTGVQVDWWRVDDPNVNREAVASYSLKQCGKPYSSLLRMVFNFSLLSKWIRRKLGIPVANDPDRPFCSELVAAALEYAGYTGESPGGTSPGGTSPGDVAMFTCLKRMGGLR